MKNYLLLSIILFLVFTLEAVTPKAAADPNPLKRVYLTWNDSVPLKWSDFQGKALENAPEAAMTSSQVEYSLFIKDSQADTGYVWSVKAKFFPKLSWSKKDKQSNYILKHEQMHFAITELYARLLRKRLGELSGKNKTKANFKATAKEVMQLWSMEQNTYDLETRHSIDEAKQAEWNQIILQRLDELKAYANF